MGANPSSRMPSTTRSASKTEGNVTKSPGGALSRKERVYLEKDVDSDGELLKPQSAIKERQIEEHHHEHHKNKIFYYRFAKSNVRENPHDEDHTWGSYGHPLVVRFTAKQSFTLNLFFVQWLQ